MYFSWRPQTVEHKVPEKRLQMPAHVYNSWQLITNSESSKSAGSTKDLNATRNMDELKI